MAGSFSQELEELLNPLPKFADPEDDGDEATKARVTEGFQEDEDEEDALGLSALRKNNTDLLPVTYGRYKGKRVTRQQLMMDMQGTGEEDEEDDDDNDDDDDDDVEDEEDEEGSMDDLEDEEIDSDELGDADDGDDEISDRKTPKKGDITFPQGVDFRKLTEGMDDLGVSGDDDDDDEDGGESVEDTEGSDEEESTGDEEVDEDGGTVQTFSRQKVDEEVEKGKAVQNQLTLWDEMLKGRIKLQKALVTANQLPQPQTLPEFKRRGGAEVAGALKNTHKALKALQRSLLELHDQLLYQNAETRSVVLDEEPDEDEDEGEDGPLPGGGPPKRKLEMAEYPELAAKRFAAFQPYSNATLQKWHDKTRLNMGKSSKGFGAFERNILTQVEQVLMDQERLVRRTQTKRTEYRILGKKEATDTSSEAAPADGEEAQHPLKTNAHLKDLDEDIFDDDDFYHQLLRELIERKTSAADPNDQVAMGRQWLAIQKLRSKIKKKVDTKASKGRKVRFHIHSKLVNFMAPIDHSSMGDDARSELYRGLFGQNAAARE